MPVCSAIMRVASCSADISSEKKADDAAIDCDRLTIWPRFARDPCLGDIVANVGSERGFAHAGAAGKDDQIGLL